MTTRQYLLTVDLGSGGPKVALVADDGQVLAARRGTVETFLLPGGGAEQDAEEWWQVIRQLAREILAERLVRVEEIAAICCAAQWSVIVPVDRQGLPLGRAVHWLDGRGAPHTKRLMHGLVRVSGYGVGRLVRWLRTTVAAPTHSGADSLAHLLYLKHDCPERWREAYKFLEPSDYLGFRLSGRCAASYATIFPYLLTNNRDATRVRYDGTLLKLSGIEEEKLPELLPVNTVLGKLLPEVADDWGLSRETRVVIGTGDSHAALLGSGAVLPYAAHVCVGTSSWLSCHVPFSRVDILSSLATMPSAVHGQNMVVAEQGPAGKCLEVLVDQWFSEAGREATEEQRGRLFERVLAEAAEVDVGAVPLFLPWLNGSGPPQQDHQMRGGLLNVSLETTRGAVVRGVLEGVAYNLHWLSHSVEKLIRRPITELHYIGGGARSPLWCQILADAMGRRIKQVADPHYAIVRGAALTALLALGRVRLEEIPAKVRIAREFLPDAREHARHAARQQEFLRAFRATRPLSRRLVRAGRGET